MSQIDLVLVPWLAAIVWSAKFRPIGSISTPVYPSFALLDT